MTEENDSSQSVATMKKEMLVKLLKHIAELIENREDFEVKCVFRSGNKDGQGFMTFIPDINHKSSTEENG